jgi:hypothetical protein
LSRGLQNFFQNVFSAQQAEGYYIYCRGASQSGGRRIPAVLPCFGNLPKQFALPQKKRTHLWNMKKSRKTLAFRAVLMI